VPLIIVQGTADTAYPPVYAIFGWREIMRSTKTSMARLYFLKGLTQGLNHSLGPPQLAAATNHMEFFKAAVNWAETGNAPGPLMIIGAGITTPIPAPNCTDLGFEPEPCKCWDFIVNSTTPALRCVAPDGVDKY
jgi:hypothetical protein